MSEKRNIARAAGVLGFATIISRFMGLARDMLVSRLFGAGYYTDAFFAAFQIPNMLRRFFAEGALTSAFVPIFSEYLNKKGKDEARELASICFSVLTVVMALVVTLGIILSPLIMSLMFPGFRADSGKLELTIFLNRFMFPYIFLISLVALCMGILNTVRHFFFPAISTVFLNLSMIFCSIFLHTEFDVPITALAVGVLCGGILQLLLQMPVLYRKGFSVRFKFRPRHPAVKRIALLMGPSVFGVGVYYLNIMVGGILASLLPQGSVSYLYYAQRLFEFPQGIITVPVAQAVLPSMSRQAVAGEMDNLKESLAFGLRLTLFITIPAMAGLLACSTPIFSLLFMGGNFDFAKAEKTAAALSFYSLGLVFVAMVRVLVPAFYSLRDTATPVKIAFVAFVLNAAFSLILMKPLLHGGLALASSLSSMFNMALLLYYLRRKIGCFGGRGIMLAGLKTIAAAIPMFMAVRWGVHLINWSINGEKLFKASALVAIVTGGIMIFLFCAYLIRCEETRETVKLICGKREGG
ncbi:MAG TPA: murein biosynthesis integral membrane protein MurJ [Geobacteraceae bacterium]|nr:murein biosynthesis integral membrane protein MurJ [Geobacteraceae bacterium]